MDNWKPRSLVIGPGGIKGLMILGCLVPLEDYGLLKYVDTYCGVSVGSIISLLIIIGYNIREIISKACQYDFFTNLSYLNISDMIDHKGILSNEPLRQKLSKLILKKMGTIPTLYDLYMKTGKSLITTTLNMTDEKTEYMNYKTHPNTSCLDAVMYSVNIPFIYYQLIDKNGNSYVDGALGNPYPVDFLDNQQTNILGIYVKVMFDKQPDLINYTNKIIEVSMNQTRLSMIEKSSVCCRHILLETQHNSIIGLSFDIKDAADLVYQGFKKGNAFLNNIRQEHDVKLKYEYPEYYLIQ